MAGTKGCLQHNPEPTPVQQQVAWGQVQWESKHSWDGGFLPLLGLPLIYQPYINSILP